ncbi:MAG: diguanylate cyclase [Phycisphaerae bacterium]
MLSVILPWFPIVLSAAVGARLVGRSRAMWLGLCCTVYFVIVVQMTTGARFWTDPTAVAAVLAGGAAILGMAEWSGRYGDAAVKKMEGLSEPQAPARGLPTHSDASCRALARAIEQFDDWLAEHRFSADPWPAFDEFLRNLLYNECAATHCRPYRILSEGDAMMPLREMEHMDGGEEKDVSTDAGRDGGAEHWRAKRSPVGSPLNGGGRQWNPRRGIVGHVATTGRSYYAGDESQGEMVLSLAEGNRSLTVVGRGGPAGTPAWCFAVRQGARSIGIVWVGELGRPTGSSMSDDCRVRAIRAPSAGAGSAEERGFLTPDALRVWERLVTQFWTTLTEVCRGRAAVQTDPVSKLMTQDAFLDEAARAAEASYRYGEPLAMCVITVEGLTTLTDQGRWDLANDVVYEVAKCLRDAVRPDDLLGRFDDTRFLVMLRRVDSELASLIATKTIERLTSMANGEWRMANSERGLEMGDFAIHNSPFAIRCGIAGSGNGDRAVGELVRCALRVCHEARARSVPVATDVEGECRMSNVECRTWT